ncbi:hypothetical protein [Klebsiella grimontii]|uniref:hypothetical protein n=1 Tax=Klebsiella grimontii TaxID=2058152 RepID=UPI001CCBA66C|nr:hypothetical protein [Klebsiella grimontii]MBZ7672108.1 hypothetical protein [Klebsiella grimontii]
MTDQQMEDLVERIIQRLRPPVLVMVTAAAGYRHAIRQRLASCGESLHLALDSGIGDGEQWRAIGKTLAAADWQQELPSASYKALLLPFLDYPLAADLVKGSLHSPVARRVHDALLSGLPVLALRYHCDPASELNQLRGAQPDTAYAGHMQATLARLAECGIALCTMNELLEKLASGREATAASANNPRRYLTVTDVVNNPALACAPEAQLTDAAIDFLKNRKKEPYLK